MFSGLLQVDDCADAEPLELSDDVVLLDELLAQPLRGDDVVVDPVRVEACDGRPLDLCPVFERTRRASAELADELGLFFEARCDLERPGRVGASDGRRRLQLVGCFAAGVFGGEGAVVVEVEAWSGREYRCCSRCRCGRG